ncbi:unnamed protein product [Ixodes hexagonus]
MGREGEDGDSGEASPKLKPNVHYAKSRNGVLSIIEMVLSLLAFISVESVSECRGYFNCSPPGYLHSYRFFAFVSFTSFIVTGAIFAARMLGTTERVPLPVKYRLFVECLYLALTIVLYFFANAFMIAHHGNRLGYQCAAVFGVVAMAFYCIQLAMYLGEYPFSDILPFRAAQVNKNRQGDDNGSRLSWEAPPGVNNSDGQDGGPSLGPVVLRPRRSSVDSRSASPNLKVDRMDRTESAKTSRSASRNSECAETASINSSNFVSVDLDGVTSAPQSSGIPA